MALKLSEMGVKSSESRAGLAIETDGLTKRYGERIIAVNSLALRVAQGEVYGFLGPNGAGKTTTLRMLVGLVRPTSGNAVVMGSPPGSREGLARIGVLIEGPAFYPYLSGHDNLRIIAKYAGAEETAIHRALLRVQLSERAADRYASYSLGMKQRLGVAAALLKEPELLILDEPANGLDPAGMAEMRVLIRELAHDGRTVLVSSHLMSEVEQVCDRVGVIRAGTLVAEGTVEDLRGGRRLRVRASPLSRAARIAALISGVAAVTVTGAFLEITAAPELAGSINNSLVNAGIEVAELYEKRDSLEQTFLELTQSADREAS